MGESSTRIRRDGPRLRPRGSLCGGRCKNVGRCTKRKFDIVERIGLMLFWPFLVLFWEGSNLPHVTCRSQPSLRSSSHPPTPTQDSQPPSSRPCPPVLSLTMAQQNSFRSQLAGFRWANSVQDDSAANPTLPPPPTSLWNSFQNSVSGYVPLRSADRTNEEEAYFALSRWERYVHGRARGWMSSEMVS